MVVLLSFQESWSERDEVCGMDGLVHLGGRAGELEGDDHRVTHIQKLCEQSSEDYSQQT